MPYVQGVQQKRQSLLTSRALQVLLRLILLNTPPCFIADLYAIKTHPMQELMLPTPLYLAYTLSIHPYTSLRNYIICCYVDACAKNKIRVQELEGSSKQ